MCLQGSTGLMTVLCEQQIIPKVRQCLEKSVFGMIRGGKMEEGKEANFHLINDSYLSQ